MGTSAGAAVERVDRNDTNGSRAIGRLPQSDRDGRLFERHPDLAILGDQVVGAGLRLQELGDGKRVRVEVQRGSLRAEMHAHGCIAKQLFEQRRQ